MEPIEQCFPVVLFLTLYKVVLTFQPVNEILKCDLQAIWKCFLAVLFITLYEEIRTFEPVDEMCEHLNERY